MIFIGGSLVNRNGTAFDRVLPCGAREQIKPTYFDVAIDIKSDAGSTALQGQLAVCD
jgi:hypothetical protein